MKDTYPQIAKQDRFFLISHWFVRTLRLLSRLGTRWWSRELNSRLNWSAQNHITDATCASFKDAKSLVLFLVLFSYILPAFIFQLPFCLCNRSVLFKSHNSKLIRDEYRNVGSKAAVKVSPCRGSRVFIMMCCLFLDLLTHRVGVEIGTTSTRCSRS
jgi:hypothetical protein